MGAWSRFESWLVEVQADRERVARWMVIAGYVSTATVVLGFLLMLLILLGLGPR